MTCAGLVALATALGLQTELRQVDARPDGTPAPRRDEDVQAALDRLEQDLLANNEQLYRRGGLASNLYFLWSLERVGVFFGLSEIGRVDWYHWGAGRLIRSQRADGSWTSSYGDAIDTAFALLFLSRSNLSPELSRALADKFDFQSRSMKAFLPGSNPAAVFAEDDAVLLLLELDDATKERKRKILDALRDRKGGGYTQALSDAIPRLNGDDKTYARQCLAERMQRMTVKTLRRKFGGDDAEVRLAAIEAAGPKDAGELIPDLIGLLRDADDAVWQAAHRSLCQLAREDFGPRADSGTVERFEASVAWRKWWESREQAAAPSAQDGAPR